MKRLKGFSARLAVALLTVCSWFTASAPTLIVASVVSQPAHAACLLDGVNDRLWSDSGAPLSGNTSGTIVAWVKSVDQNADRDIVMFYAGATVNTRITLGVNSSEAATAYAGQNSGGSGGSSAGTGIHGSWRTLAARFSSASSRTANVDGTDGSANTTTVTQTDTINRMRIGTRSPNFWNGKIHAIAVYSTDIGASNIAQLAASGPAAYTTNRVAFWDMSADCPSTVEDSVGSYDLTRDGATYDAEAPNFSSIAFSAGPTVTAAANGFTIGGTLTGTGTLVTHAVACAPAKAAPSVAQRIAHQCGDGNAADIAAQETWSTTVADTFALTDVNSWPRYDVYVAATNGTLTADGGSFADQTRTARSGYAIQVLASVAAASPFAVQSDATCDTDAAQPGLLLNCSPTALIPYLQPGHEVTVSAGLTCSPCVVASTDGTTIRIEQPVTTADASNVTTAKPAYFVPAVAAGDVWEVKTTTSLGNAFTPSDDGLGTITDLGEGVHRLDYNIQDVSGASNFTGGPPNWPADDSWYVNVERPALARAIEPEEGEEGEIVLDPTPGTLVLKTGIPMTPVQVVSTDPNGFATVVQERSALPLNLDVDEAGHISGIPSTEDEDGTDYYFDARSAVGLYATPLKQPIVSVDTVTVSNCIASDTPSAECIGLLALKWLNVTTTERCAPDKAPGHVYQQAPEAGTEAEPFSSVALTLSNGPCIRQIPTNQ